MCLKSIAAVRCAAGLALAAATGLSACDGSRPGPTNLVLFVSDTFRADALDCQKAAERTPQLCALAARGTLFERAYSGAPWTLPSAVTLFTGSHPTAYGRWGATRAKEFRDERTRDEFYHVPDSERMLADVLAERGYDTLRFAEGGVAAQTNAFQTLAAPAVEPAAARRAAGELLPGLPAHLRDDRYNHYLGALQYLTRWSGQPFFLLLWVHDPHAIYSPPGSFRKRLATDDLGLSRRPRFYEGLGHQEDAERGLRSLREVAPQLTPDELAYLRQLYQLEVESVDERVGMLLELLRQRGLEHTTLVVFTSDHGEGFGEHERFLHGNSFYEELLRVPLLMAGPGIPSGRRVMRRVSHVDLMPTLCDLLDADCLPNAQGRSLRPLLEGGEEPARPIYVASPLRYEMMDALVDGDFKLVVSASGELELYDLAGDPGEQRNLAEEHPERVEPMLRRLRQIRRESELRRGVNLADVSEQRLDETRENTTEQLRALGYVE